MEREREKERVSEENGELISLVNKTRERQTATPHASYSPLLHNGPLVSETELFSVT